MKIPKIKHYITWIVVLSLIECAISGYIAWWRDPFWNAVNAHNEPKFWIYIGYFTMAALMICYVSGKNQYLQRYAALNYRRQLTRKALTINNLHVEGRPQRIQEDCLTYPDLSISLIIGLLRNITLLAVFFGVLSKQLGLIYMILPIIYSIIGTIIASKLAKPLISLNYINQVLEASFRQFLTKRGYGKVHRNNVKLFKATKELSYFQYFYGQISVIIPYLILSSLYFSMKLTFGALMQCASAMNSIIDCMSYFINSFNDINKWLSCRKRLKELEVI